MALTERRGADDGVTLALETLRSEIAQRVRLEQLRDQLTGLPNEPALRAAMQELLERKSQFWIAFIEIDRFKAINDEFGYQAADALLLNIAEVVRGAAQFFVAAVTAFRPHGDEFYLVGDWGTDVETESVALAGTLDLLRRNISEIKVRAEAGVARCTVSIGWLETVSFEKYLAEKKVVLTQREVLTALERTVAEAKWTRNVVTKFDPAVEADEVVNLRSDCATCRCKFQVDVKRSKAGLDASWWCPNCGTMQPRPPTAKRSPGPQPASI